MAQPQTIESEPPEALRPNKAHINEHLYALFAPEFVQDHPDAQIEIAYASPATDDDGPNKCENFSAFEVEKAADFAERKNQAGFNVYVGAALRDGKSRGRATKESVEAGSRAWADFDAAEDSARVSDLLRGKNVAPSEIVQTGSTPNRRFQIYVRLADKVTPDQLEAANTALRDWLGGDDVQGMQSLMRLAGTINYPKPAKLGRGYIVEPVTLRINPTAPSYSVEQLTGLAGNPSSGIDSNGAARPGRDDSTLEALLENSRAPGKWHNSIRDATATMIGRGWSDLQIRLACAPYCKGGTNDPDLDHLINGARAKWNKPEAESATAAEIEILRLAKLPAIKYEQERKAAAEKLEFRASALDDMVQAERARLGFDDEDAGLQGRAISFPEPEPWPEPIDGAALLDGIAATLKRYVIMDEQASHSAALWVVHTYLLDAFMVSPRLAVRSPMKRCGKTTLLDVLGCLVMKALPTANVSAAAVFRVVEGYRPCLLVDEADTFLAESDDLRGVLNSGHRRGGSVLRTVGDDHEPRAFATYSAVAIGIIGALPDTLADRSIPVVLKRKLLSEVTESFRIDRVGHLEVLARKAARWASDNAEAIAAADPGMPPGVHSRAADNWRSLLAVADAAGGEWPKLAQAAASQAASETEAESMTELLLGDIRGAFATDEAVKVRDMFGAEQIEITSAALVKTLVALDGRPWGEMGKARKPLTQNRLARLLKPLGISPENVGPEDNRVRGYKFEHFQEAFARYLSPEGSSQPPICTEAHEIRTSHISEVHSPDDGCADGKSKKPNNDGVLGGCAVAKGDTGEEQAIGASEAPPDDIPTDRTCVQCRGEIDGTERLVSVSGRSVWLHDVCERFWIGGLDEGHGS